MRDKELMMAFRGCWQDGQGAVSWIAGLHIAEWVGHVPQKNRDKTSLEEIMLNTEYTLNLAAERLETIAWFGLLERRDESLNTFNMQFPMQHKVCFYSSSLFESGVSDIAIFDMLAIVEFTLISFSSLTTFAELLPGRDIEPLVAGLWQICLDQQNSSFSSRYRRIRHAYTETCRFL